MDSLITFQRAHYRPSGDKTVPCSHTSMAPKIGMHIPADKEKKLHKKIVAANREVRAKARKGYNVQRHCVIERPMQGLDAVSFFRIEIDLKQPKWMKHRSYSSTNVEGLARIVWEVLDQYIDVKRRYKQLFFFEKERPTLKRGDPEKQKVDMWSDGFKFMAPYVHIPNSLFYLAIHEMRELARERGLFDNVIIENKLEDVFDIGVVENSGWTMYGGCKPEGLPYNLTKVYGYDIVPIDAEYSPDDLVSLLSIRRSKRRERAEYAEDVSKDLIEERLAKFEAKKVAAKQYQHKKGSLSRMQEMGTAQDEKAEADLVASAGITAEQKNEIEQAQKLIAMIAKSRTTNYIEWMRIGWALRKIHHSLLPTWIAFSKNAPNFKRGECEKLWSKMHYDGFGLAALRLWAAKDNPRKFKEYRTSQIHGALYKGLNGTTFNMASVLKDYLGAMYVSASTKQDEWYVFTNGHYEPDDGRSLSTRLSVELVDEYLKLAAYYNEQAVGKTGMEKDQLIAQATNVTKIITKLLGNKYKNEVIAEARTLFYIKNFKGLLDANQNYLGMKDGVYDLQALEMRDGVPEDMMSMSTGHKFMPYDEKNEQIKWVYNFMKQLQPNERVREYLWMLFASCLDGFNREEKFHLLTGKGCFDGDTEVLMADGSRNKVRHLKMKDELMGWDSRPRTITQLFHNRGMMYKITSASSTMRVSAEHKLVLYMDDLKAEVSKSTGRTLVSWVEQEPDKASVKYCEEYLAAGEAGLIDRFTELKKREDVVSGTIVVVKAEDFVQWPHTVRSLCRIMHTELDGSELGEQKVPISVETMGRWIGQEACKNFGARIPREYIANSNAVRANLFKAVVANSTCSDKGHMIFSTEDLVKDVLLLARSVGLGSRVKKLKDVNKWHVQIDGKWDGMEEFTAVEDGEDAFYGFELSIHYLDEHGKEAWDTESEECSKFLLGDLTVASNSNGKSKLIALIQQALGDYCSNVDSSLFTKKNNGGAEGASPVRASLRGKRVVISSEAEQGESLSMSLIKSMSGGDSQTVRPLYGTPFTFTLNAKFLFAVNSLPYVKAEDAASWRRLRVVGFLSRFCDKPDKKKQEFAIDMDLASKIPEHAPAMLSILIHKYKAYKKMGNLKDIPEVMANTNSYRNDNNVLAEFSLENLEKRKKGKENLTNLYGNVFLKWLKTASPTAPMPSRKEFQTFLEDEMKCTIKAGTVHGIAIKDCDMMDMTD
jgi:P4 family phage/plasmid primase-like protien